MLHQNDRDTVESSVESDEKEVRFDFKFVVEASTDVKNITWPLRAKPSCKNMLCPAKRTKRELKDPLEDFCGQ